MRGLCIAIVVALGLAVAAPAAHAQAGYQIHVGEEQGGRSGFWTSRKPASGGAYRWRLLGIAVGLLAVTGGGMLLLVRNAKLQRERTARPQGDRDQ